LKIEALCRLLNIVYTHTNKRKTHIIAKISIQSSLLSESEKSDFHNSEMW